ncbi:flagellar motor switch phosphatase FliY [Thalassobacillus sp. C254]|uniref:flagellar motor switch phosphatase FliY n=1 Tax=Thalassobacillus sp. C254 TaxID=1225341 RepID=UPI000A3E3D98|nr:flagellar motor switch phosphatase FliY [Thalassobacillus sp. C254]
MNDDMLSQEEINELLKGVNGDSDETETTDSTALNNQKEEERERNIESYLTPIEQDALGEIGNISFGSAATALSQLLNQKVEITTPVVSAVAMHELQTEFPEPCLSVNVEYTEGFQGTNLLVIKSSDASIIADLMMGGSGSVEDKELGEMEISAVQEAMNQMMGSASTSMSAIFGKRVDITPPGIEILDAETKESPADDEEMIVKISFRLKVGELIDSSIMQVVTIPFAKKMISELMETEEPDGESKPSSDTKGQEVTTRETLANKEDFTQHTKKAEDFISREALQETAAARSDSYNGGPENFHSEPDREVQTAVFSNFEEREGKAAEPKNLDMLLDIPLDVTVELGRTKRSIKDILALSHGSIIELDKLAGEPIDILVNQKLIAKGEVVVIEENFGVRVTDIISQKDRIKNLN